VAKTNKTNIHTHTQTNKQPSTLPKTLFQWFVARCSQFFERIPLSGWLFIFVVLLETEAELPISLLAISPHPLSYWAGEETEEYSIHCTLSIYSNSLWSKEGKKNTWHLKKVLAQRECKIIRTQLLPALVHTLRRIAPGTDWRTILYFYLRFFLLWIQQDNIQ